MVLTRSNVAKGNGSKFAVLSVATQRSWKNADDAWSSKTDWHRVVVFRPRLAEHVATTIKKGSRPRRRQSRQLDLRTGEMARAKRCLWRIAISLIIPEYFASCYAFCDAPCPGTLIGIVRNPQRNLVVLFIHFIALARFLVN